jgi:hypothetical protein
VELENIVKELQQKLTCLMNTLNVSFRGFLDAESEMFRVRRGIRLQDKASRRIGEQSWKDSQRNGRAVTNKRDLRMKYLLM